jgi:hypothetical protein
LAGSLLSQGAGPAGIALINCVGIAGGSAITPAVVGFLRDWSGNFSSGIFFVMATVLLAIGMISLVGVGNRAAATVSVGSV